MLWDLGLDWRGMENITLVQSKVNFTLIFKRLLLSPNHRFINPKPNQGLGHFLDHGNQCYGFLSLAHS